MIVDIDFPYMLDAETDFHSDVSCLLPYLTTTGRQAVTASDLQAVLEYPRTHLLLAWEGELVAGMCQVFCVLTPAAMLSYMHSVVVHPDFRRYGWGERLVRCAIDVVQNHVLEEGMPTVLEFTSKPKREAANAMYQKMGFKLVAAAVPDDPDGTNLYRMEIPLPTTP